MRYKKTAAFLVAGIFAGSFLMSSGTALAAKKKTKSPGAHVEALSVSRLFPDRKVTDEALSLAKDYRKNLREVYTREKFEKLYGSDMREVGNRVLDLAVLEWIQPEDDVFSALTEWCGWAIKKDTWGNNHDLEMSHLLFALAVVYDWHGPKLSFDLKEGIKNFILEHGRYQFEVGKGRPLVFWTKAYGQNHCWINYTSLLATGLALERELPETAPWVALAKEKFGTILSLLPPDGSNHEGLNYSIYGNTWLVRAMALLQPSDKDVFKRCDYLKNYAGYFEAFRVDKDKQTFFDLGDSPQYLWSQPGEIFAKLYHEYNNPTDLRLLTDYRDPVPAGHKGGRKKLGLMAAVYGMPSIKGSDRETARDTQYFSEDMGLVIEKKSAGRSSFAFLFKSGVPGGRAFQRAVLENGDIHLNVSHNHPEQNHFVIWTPEGFVISDTGNVVKKMSRDHNTLIINGQGQLGEGSRWLDAKGIAKKKFDKKDGFSKDEFFENENFSVVQAEAAAFYPPQAGLESFKRMVISLRAGSFFVFDEVLVKREAEAALRFHSDFKLREKEARQFAFEVSRGEKGSLRPFYPQDSDLEVKGIEAEAVSKDKALHTGEVLEVRKRLLSSDGFRQIFLTGISLPAFEGEQLFQEETAQIKGIVKTSSGDFEAIFPKTNKGAIEWGGCLLYGEALLVWRGNNASQGQAILFQGSKVEKNGELAWFSQQASQAEFSVSPDGSLLIHKAQVVNAPSDKNEDKAESYV